MYQLTLNNLSLSVDFAGGKISSLTLNGKERIVGEQPLFRVRLRNEKAEKFILTTFDAATCDANENTATYSGFNGFDGMSVTVKLEDTNGDAGWYISVTPASEEYLVEWVDFPFVTLPKLVDNNKNGNGGKLLMPFNEGMLVSDSEGREYAEMPYRDAEYPSCGNYNIFPNMHCSQMMAYLFDDAGLYYAAHDEKRGVKGLDYFELDDAIVLQMRLFCGVNYGDTFSTDYPVVMAAVGSSWESAAEKYREWFEVSLPKRVKKVLENPDLPEWYEDAPLIVSYCVRGIHDMDEMYPNALYPYTNALPLINEIKEATNSRILTILMHWEGTAPWAPPYVWEPYGSLENFNEFKDALHKNGDLLGVYCSGFGYTIQSNLIAEYNMQEEYDKRELWRGMCAGPDGKVEISNICTGQRSGYDICPASEVGRDLLKEAYVPLFKSGVDYAQILDQNHGGGQYFCYSKEHGHPAGPGAWMTENMQDMLGEWNDLAPNMLFGCESAAAEPFIGNLQFSDNRFEVNYKLGKPVPLHAYIYHEYLRNFMGNQVACPFRTDVDTLRYRIAYSFSAGDCMTVVLTPNGDLMTHWGTRDFVNSPNKEKTFRMIKNLTAFYKETAKDYLYAGKMIEGKELECKEIYLEFDDRKRGINLPEILSSAWESKDGKKAQILVNPHDYDATCKLDGKEITIPAMDAVLVEI